MRQYLNWKTALVLIALAIVVATLLYTNRLAAQLAIEERKNVAQLAEGIRTISMSTNDAEISFATNIIVQNKTIPMVMVDEKGEIVDYMNVDTARVKNLPNFLQDKRREFQSINAAIESDFGTGKNFIYYGESSLLKQLRYFPYLLLGIILLFLAIVLWAIRSAHRSLQNQVWVGLSKETAHQLGTPLSSIAGWVELLKDKEGNEEAVLEMEKDLGRLQLVADRFSKVGSAPQLKQEDLIPRLKEMVDYMQKRAPKKVLVALKAPDQPVMVNISGSLFDWVIENLMRNALDAMDGVGNITLTVRDLPHQTIVDVADTGKGIARHQIKHVFRPGFTTKKRGWGLGLSLSRRIVEQYHKGSIAVKASEMGKGTTFRIILSR